MAGPFQEETNAAFLGGSKLWVGSNSQDATASAFIAATNTKAGESVNQTRGPESSARAKDIKAFYPGSITLPVAGLWTILVTIGSASGCFVLRI